jgi:predicted anti-sigma-YlaC factor YlaD
VSEPLDCKAVTRFISLGLDRQLPADERERVQLHFLACRSCRTVQEQMAFLRRALRSATPEGDVPAKP